MYFSLVGEEIPNTSNFRLTTIALIIAPMMKNYQKQVDEWVGQYEIGYWKPLEIMARLTEETGELAPTPIITMRPSRVVRRTTSL